MVKGFIDFNFLNFNGEAIERPIRWTILQPATSSVV